MNPANWLPALNTKLPATIRIMDCEEVPPDFHARFSATGKTLPLPDLHRPGAAAARRRARLAPAAGIDPAPSAAALDLFHGTHDFRAFAAYRGNETPDTDFHRTLRQAALHLDRRRPVTRFRRRRVPLQDGPHAHRQRRRRGNRAGGDRRTWTTAPPPRPHRPHPPLRPRRRADARWRRLLIDEGRDLFPRGPDSGASLVRMSGSSLERCFHPSPRSRSTPPDLSERGPCPPITAQHAILCSPQVTSVSVDFPGDAAHGGS